jgi:phosphoribosylanthranilate isomerase
LSQNQNKMNDQSSATDNQTNKQQSLRIKVCGMTRLDQMQVLGEMGVEFAGMIFYPKSPRYVLNHLKGEEVRKARLKVYKVGVFVNADYDEVMKQVDDFGLDMVQLHGDESPRFCEQVSNYISVIKAFRLAPDDPISWKIRSFQDAADLFLFDTLGVGYGGTGKKFDWTVLKGEKIKKPFFLSGGIEPGDVERIREFVKESVASNLFAIDVNSCFESGPGIKKMDILRSFVETLKNDFK